MSVCTDCQGSVMDCDVEVSVGNGVCDDGSGEYDLLCAAFNYDNGDCSDSGVDNSDIIVGSVDTSDVGFIAGIAVGVVVVIIVIVIVVVVVRKRNTTRQSAGGPPFDAEQGAPGIMQPHDFSERPEPPSFMQPVIAEPVGDADAVDPNPVMATPVMASDVLLDPAPADAVDAVYA